MHARPFMVMVRNNDNLSSTEECDEGVSTWRRFNVGFQFRLSSLRCRRYRFRYSEVNLNYLIEDGGSINLGDSMPVALLHTPVMRPARSRSDD